MNLKLYIATGGPLGYTPFSGTLASLCACLFLVPFFLLTTFTVQMITLIGAFIVGWFCITYALDYFKKTDPSTVVYDEFIGMACALLACDITFMQVVIAFLLFRFFDGSKVLGIRFFEKLPGAWGVMADDIIAGCYTSLCIQGLQWYGII